MSTLLCPAPLTGQGFLGTVLAHLDCQAQTIGATGYQALAGPDSPVAILLTVFLTLAIAVFAIRMLMGQLPSVGDALGLALKIGIVLTLATSWAAYRTVIYDTVLKGPAEISANLGGAAGLPGGGGGLVARLQAVDDAVVAFGNVGAGRFETSGNLDASGRPIARVLINDELALGLARTSFDAGIIGTMGLVRLLGGVALALAPLFAGLLLFERARGVFYGWLRTLAAVALGSVVIVIILEVELAIIEPWLVDVLSLRAAHAGTPQAPLELLALTFSFALILVAGLVAATKLCFSSDISQVVRRQFGYKTNNGATMTESGQSEVQQTFSGQADNTEVPRRALAVATALSESDQRGTWGRQTMQILNTGELGSEASATIRKYDDNDPVIPLGETYRRTGRRVSSAATQRSAAR